MKTAPQPIPAAVPGSKTGSVPRFKPAFPEFTAGAGYVIPGQFAGKLYDASLTVKFLPVEDVFTTGFTAKKIGLYTQHDPRFSCGQMVQRETVCSMADKFNGHKVTPDLQRELMKQTLDDFRHCR